MWWVTAVCCVLYTKRCVLYTKRCVLYTKLCVLYTERCVLTNMNNQCCIKGRVELRLAEWVSCKRELRCCVYGDEQRLPSALMSDGMGRECLEPMVSCSELMRYIAWERECSSEKRLMKTDTGQLHVDCAMISAAICEFYSFCLVLRPAVLKVVR
jgi:hypothetical protein